jgi:hypothetical protein
LGRWGLLVVRLDGLLEVVALDESHGIAQKAIVMDAEVVYRHNPGMLQAAVDLRPQHESASEITRLPLPLVRPCRSRTTANVDLIELAMRMCLICESPAAAGHDPPHFRRRASMSRILGTKGAEQLV